MTYSAAVRIAWPTSCASLEGRIAWPYLDIRRIVTVGLGCAFLSPGPFAMLPWLHADGRHATADEAATAWQFLHTMLAARVASAYAYPGHLHLAEETIDQLARARLDDDVAMLTRRWPDFADFPAYAQAALLAMAWAVGAGAVHPGLTSLEWPHLQAAVDLRDWRSAAKAGQIRWEYNPGVRPRDWLVEALFTLAAGGSHEEARAGWVAGSSGEAAEKALASMVAAIEAELAEVAPTTETWPVSH